MQSARDQINKIYITPKILISKNQEIDIDAALEKSLENHREKLSRQLVTHNPKENVSLNVTSALNTASNIVSVHDTFLSELVRLAIKEHGITVNKTGKMIMFGTGNRVIPLDFTINYLDNLDDYNSAEAAGVAALQSIALYASEETLRQGLNKASVLATGGALSKIPYFGSAITIGASLLMILVGNNISDSVKHMYDWFKENILGITKNTIIFKIEGLKVSVDYQIILQMPQVKVALLQELLNRCEEFFRCFPPISMNISAIRRDDYLIFAHSRNGLNNYIDFNSVLTKRFHWLRSYAINEGILIGMIWESLLKKYRKILENYFKVPDDQICRIGIQTKEMEQMVKKFDSMRLEEFAQKISPIGILAKKKMTSSCQYFYEKIAFLYDFLLREEVIYCEEKYYSNDLMRMVPAFIEELMEYFSHRIIDENFLEHIYCIYGACFPPVELIESDALYSLKKILREDKKSSMPNVNIAYIHVPNIQDRASSTTKPNKNYKKNLPSTTSLLSLGKTKQISCEPTSNDHENEREVDKSESEKISNEKIYFANELPSDVLGQYHKNSFILTISASDFLLLYLDENGTLKTILLEKYKNLKSSLDSIILEKSIDQLSKSNKAMIKKIIYSHLDSLKPASVSYEVEKKLLHDLAEDFKESSLESLVSIVLGANPFDTFNHRLLVNVINSYNENFRKYPRELAGETYCLLLCLICINYFSDGNREEGIRAYQQIPEEFFKNPSCWTYHYKISSILNYYLVNPDLLAKPTNKLAKNDNYIKEGIIQRLEEKTIPVKANYPFLHSREVDSKKSPPTNNNISLSALKIQPVASKPKSRPKQLLSHVSTRSGTVLLSSSTSKNNASTTDNTNVSSKIKELQQTLLHHASGIHPCGNFPRSATAIETSTFFKSPGQASSKTSLPPSAHIVAEIATSRPTTKSQATLFHQENKPREAASIHRQFTSSSNDSVATMPLQHSIKSAQVKPKLSLTSHRSTATTPVDASSLTQQTISHQRSSASLYSVHPMNQQAALAKNKVSDRVKAIEQMSKKMN